MHNQFKGYFYSLLVWPITGEHFIYLFIYFKLNPSAVDKCKLKLWLQIYVPVVYFLYVGCTNRYSYSLDCLAVCNNFKTTSLILNIHSLNTVDKAKKIGKNWKLCKLCGFLLRGSHKDMM